MSLGQRCRHSERSRTIASGPSTPLRVTQGGDELLSRCSRGFDDTIFWSGPNIHLKIRLPLRGVLNRRYPFIVNVFNTFDSTGHHQRTDVHYLQSVSSCVPSSAVLRVLFLCLSLTISAFYHTEDKMIRHMCKRFRSANTLIMSIVHDRSFCRIPKPYSCHQRYAS